MRNVATLCNPFVPFLPYEMRFCKAVQNSADSLGSIMSPLLPPRLTGISVASMRGRMAFGQIRTLELRDLARIRQTGNLIIYPLRCGAEQNYVEIAQPCEVFKSGSNPVRVAPVFHR